MRGRARFHQANRARLEAPLTLPNREAWYRADDPAIIYGSGSLVNTLPNRFGGGRNFVQTTGANQFTQSTSDAAYGNRAVLTTGGNAFMDASSSGPASQPLTIYVVGQIGTSADYKTFLDAVTGNRVIVRANASEFSSTFAGTANVESTASIAGPSVLCCVFNAASSAHYVNSTTAAVTGNPGSNGTGTMRLGATPTGTYLLPADGKIAEIIIYSAAHDATQRATILRYLSTRYNLSVTGL